MSVKRLLSRLRKDIRGTSAVEYGIICVMIGVGLVAAVKGVADENGRMWNTVTSKSAAAMANP